LVERGSRHLALDHAFGFESLPDCRSGLQSRCARKCDALDGSQSPWRTGAGRSTVNGIPQGIVFVLLRRRRIAHFRFRRHSRPLAGTCRWPPGFANDPKAVICGSLDHSHFFHSMAVDGRFLRAFPFWRGFASDTAFDLVNERHDGRSLARVFHRFPNCPFWREQRNEHPWTIIIGFIVGVIGPNFIIARRQGNPSEGFIWTSIWGS